MEPLSCACIARSAGFCIAAAPARPTLPDHFLCSFQAGLQRPRRWSDRPLAASTLLSLSARFPACCGLSVAKKAPAWQVSPEPSPQEQLLRPPAAASAHAAAHCRSRSPPPRSCKLQAMSFPRGRSEQERLNASFQGNGYSVGLEISSAPLSPGPLSPGPLSPSSPRSPQEERQLRQTVRLVAAAVIFGLLVATMIALLAATVLRCAAAALPVLLLAAGCLACPRWPARLSTWPLLQGVICRQPAPPTQRPRPARCPPRCPASPQLPARGRRGVPHPQAEGAAGLGRRLAVAGGQDGIPHRLWIVCSL